MADLAQSVREASCRAEVTAAVEQVYAELAHAIEERKPICAMSGRCCRFEEYGHRLYVTTLELAAFLDAWRHSRVAVSATTEWDGSGCLWQKVKLCGVHAFRPFGCRIYFCDPSAKRWQEELYERLHAKLKLLHDSLEVPYFYVEWRLAVRSLPELLGGNPPR